MREEGNSVLYVAFRSQVVISPAQLKERQNLLDRFIYQMGTLGCFLG
jgi:hypothetical protein